MGHALAVCAVAGPSRLGQATRSAHPGLTNARLFFAVGRLSREPSVAASQRFIGEGVSIALRWFPTHVGLSHVLVLALVLKLALALTGFVTMRPMGRGSGIKLTTTGETIGAWSLADHDGHREEPSNRGEEPSKARLPRGGEAATADDAQEADAFADRMMENLIYKRLKLQRKQATATTSEPGGSGKSAETHSVMTPTDGSGRQGRSDEVQQYRDGRHPEDEDRDRRRDDRDRDRRRDDRDHDGRRDDRDRDRRRAMIAIVTGGETIVIATGGETIVIMTGGEMITIVTAGAMIVIVTGEETIGIVSADTTIVMVTGGQTALAATATSTASRCDAMSHKMARKAVFACAGRSRRWPRKAARHKQQRCTRTRIGRCTKDDCLAIQRRNISNGGGDEPRARYARPQTAQRYAPRDERSACSTCSTCSSPCRPWSLRAVRRSRSTLSRPTSQTNRREGGTSWHHAEPMGGTAAVVTHAQTVT